MHILMRARVIVALVVLLCAQIAQANCTHGDLVPYAGAEDRNAALIGTYLGRFVNGEGGEMRLVVESIDESGKAVVWHGTGGLCERNETVIRFGRVVVPYPGSTDRPVTYSLTLAGEMSGKRTGVDGWYDHMIKMERTQSPSKHVAGSE